MLQEVEQQLLRQELRQQRKKIQLNTEMLQRQEKQKRRERQQELERQQRLKKEENRQQLELRRHDNLSLQQNTATASNDIAVALNKSVKTMSIINNQLPCHSIPNIQNEVDVTKKQMCAEYDVSVKTLRAEHDKDATSGISKNEPTFGIEDR